MDRFEIIRNESGFMAYDHDCDQFLYNDQNQYCFDSKTSAQDLINDAIITINELESE